MNKNLTTCSDCGREVSKNAAACPNCGKPIKLSPINLLAKIILGVGVVVICFWILGNL